MHHHSIWSQAHSVGLGRPTVQLTQLMKQFITLAVQYEVTFHKHVYLPILYADSCNKLHMLSIYITTCLCVSNDDNSAYSWIIHKLNTFGKVLRQIEQVKHHHIL